MGENDVEIVYAFPLLSADDSVGLNKDNYEEGKKSGRKNIPGHGLKGLPHVICSRRKMTGL